jgi:hypothetical protein
MLRGHTLARLCPQVISVEHRAHGVDTPEDVIKVEELMRRKGIA